MILERPPGSPGGPARAAGSGPGRAAGRVAVQVLPAARRGRANGNAGGLEVIANDDELMRLTAGGDEGAFRRLVERWQQPVLAFLERMTGDREEARDLGQEAFYRVFTQAPRYRPAGQFRAWLFSIAGNLARTWLRRRRVLRWISFDVRRHDLPSPGANGHERVEREEGRERVRRALARLPDRQRQAVLLQRFEGMSYQEVAATMGATIPAVESLLQRAMASLRADLAPAADLAPGGARLREPSRAPSPDAP